MSLPLTDKTPLAISDLPFPLGEVAILRALPSRREYRLLAGPYYGAEIPLLRAALLQLAGAVGVAIAEEQGGITIFRRLSP